MTKEKRAKLVKYQQSLRDRLGAIPVKHVSSPKTYVEFLNRELKTVTAQLDATKMDGVK